MSRVAHGPARCLVVAASVLLGAACGDDSATDDGVTPQGTIEELMNSKTCEGCHPNHYRQWASSMHAYSAEDPVFLAMNARGQRETDGELGDFCVKCHAPMAVREGLTTDGLNLDEVPDHMEGVSCYFCHNVVEVTGTHDAALRLANDTTMRGGFEDATSNRMHASEYSTLHDSQHSNSSKMCGACHDIVTQGGVELERTFKEWRDSVHSKPEGFSSCGGCHMDSNDGIAAEDPDVNVPTRKVHEHLWAGVDVALTDFPDTDVQRAAIECALRAAVAVSLCPDPTGRVTVRLEGNAGHMWPSGAAQDRRGWLELVAYNDADEVIWSTGQVADDEVVDKHEGEPGYDRRLWVLRDRLFDQDGNETHMFWEAARYESELLPATQTWGMAHYLEREFAIGTEPARLEARVKIRPMDFDVLQDLVDSADLDPAVLERIPTFTLQGSVTRWSRDTDGYESGCVTKPDPDDLVCPLHYTCILDPNSPGCDAL